MFHTLQKYSDWHDMGDFDRFAAFNPQWFKDDVFAEMIDSPKELIGRIIYNGRQWAAFLPEMSVEGCKYRIQIFDRSGFVCHDSFKTEDELFKAAVNHGFVSFDDGALDRLSCSLDWRIGSYRTGLIMKMNCRQIKFEEFDPLLKAFIDNLTQH